LAGSAGDGILNDGEVESTIVICNGADGDDGAAALAEVTAVEPGDECTTGGVKLHTGLDENGDGTLEEDEVLRSQTICSEVAGTDGGSSLTIVEETGPNEACPAGGFMITSGGDFDGDGELDGEPTYEAVICHGQDGAPGADGLNSLVVTTEAAAADCPNGGKSIQTGIDEDRDGTLDADEVDATSHICNAQPSPSSLTTLQPLEEGAQECNAGGVRIDTGLDINGNGVLETEEVTDSAAVCRGEPGKTGEPGASCAATGDGIGLSGFVALIGLFSLRRRRLT
jgi:hypothetical protein